MAPSGPVDANAYMSGCRASCWRAQALPWLMTLCTSRSFVAPTVSLSCRSVAGMRAADSAVATRAPPWSPEANSRTRSPPEETDHSVVIGAVAAAMNPSARTPGASRVARTESPFARLRARHHLAPDANRSWFANESASSISGDHGGSRVVTGKSAARIPAAERHDGLTVAATKEREVQRLIHHGSTRACQQVARHPLM